MKSFGLMTTLNILFLGFMLSFIYFYFSFYQPLKADLICADKSAHQVAINKSVNAYDAYYANYHNCLIEQKTALLTFFK